MKLSVVICTFRRADYLSDALASLAQAQPPRFGGWEVVVVGNDGAQTTADAAQAFADRLPLRFVEQPEAGLSQARNMGVAVATGDYILWADDDVLFDPSWLRAYETVFLRHPEACVFGGTIIPVLEGETPVWLSEAAEKVENVFAARRPAADAPPFHDGARELPFGANYAVRAVEQKRRRYDPNLGRKPGPRLMGGEETALIRALLAEGGVGVWAPAAVVRHRMPPERGTRAYLEAYFIGQGWLRAETEMAEGRCDAASLRKMIRRMRYNKALAGALWRTPFKRRWITAFKRAAVAEGYVRRLQDDAPDE